MVSKMAEELKFPQRWDFRMNKNDFDSSSNDSKSGGDGALNKFRLFSGLVPADDENNDASKIPTKGKCGPDAASETKSRRAPARRRARSKKDDSEVAETKRKKMKQSSDEKDGLDDLKKFMNSLVDDLKVTKEGLVVWMRQEIQKMGGEDDDFGSKTDKGSSRIQKEDLQTQINPLQSTEVQSQNIFGKNLVFQQKNMFNDQEQTQIQQKNMFNGQEQTQIQQKNMFKDQEQLQTEKKPENNVNLQNQQQHWNNFMSWTRFQDYSAGTSAERFCRSKKQDESSGKLAQEHRPHFGQDSAPISKPENKTKELITFSRKSKSKTNPPQQNLQVEPKSVVLAITAQKRSSKRSSRGKRTENSKKLCSKTEEQIDYSKAIVSIPPAENTEEILQLSSEPKFSANSSCQVPPTFLSKYKPRIAPSQTAMNTERSSFLLGSGSHHGYIMGVQPEERTGSMFCDETRYRNYFNGNISMTSLLGNGFHLPFHQAFNGSLNIPSFENLQEVNSSLRMSGGAIRYLGSSQASPADPYIVNNFHGYQFPGPHS